MSVTVSYLSQFLSHLVSLFLVLSLFPDPRKIEENKTKRVQEGQIAAAAGLATTELAAAGGWRIVAARGVRGQRDRWIREEENRENNPKPTFRSKKRGADPVFGRRHQIAAAMAAIAAAICRDEETRRFGSSVASKIRSTAIARD